MAPQANRFCGCQVLRLCGTSRKQVGKRLVSREGDPQLNTGADNVLVGGSSLTGGVLANLYSEVDQGRDSGDRSDQFADTP